ncbi:hypothetical protein [Clostridium lacusfryxellense]|uniref:hypothetical protein n=1 Tax=Clostridium lacusfryxellense TaxID=205328 RepID=UPI001C0B62FE|nr:hypothetical protein [Clostridium lacusfryxellense]MBU3113618.1 hypothetical protein [Clostridium lacusfryxellense]
MSIISNISILQNPSAKKAFSSISFEVGENFNARIVSTDEEKGEVNLKLLDGWQFTAKLDKSLEQFMDGSVLKFEVEGFEDGKLIIKLADDNKKNAIVENDTLQDFFHGELVEAGRDDVLIFEKMLKHDMPLTKENIIDIKNLLDFKDKISLDTDKEDVFIGKYLNSRNIDINSEKGIEITKILKNFFQALKSLNIDEILLFKGNNIQLNKGNLESFIKLFKGDSAIYNNLKDLNSYLLNNDITEEIPVDTKITTPPINLNNNIKEIVKLINSELKNLDIEHSVDTNLKLKGVISNKSTINTLVDEILKAEKIPLSEDNHSKLLVNVEKKLEVIQSGPGSRSLESINNNEETHSSNTQINAVSEMDNKSIKVNGYSKNNSLSEIINMIKKELSFSEIDKSDIDGQAIDNEVKDNNYKDIQKITTDVLIKDQIKLKTEEIKNMVREIIENKINLKPETYEKVMNVFEQKINDLKVYNSISQEYYYLDLPINVNENEYQFKLIIKDDRKESKQIDSKNVKIATSIKTINMGTVDAYIKIKNNNMNIDINCNELFIKVLEHSKDQLVKDLSSLSYKVNIKINNKPREFSLASCGEFFDDRSFNTINIKV